MKGDWLTKLLRGRIQFPRERPKRKQYDCTRRVDVYGPYDDQDTKQVMEAAEALGLPCTWWGDPQHYNCCKATPTLVYHPENRCYRNYVGVKRCRQFLWQERRRQNR